MIIIVIITIIMIMIIIIIVIGKFVVCLVFVRAMIRVAWMVS